MNSGGRVSSGGRRGEISNVCQKGNGGGMVVSTLRERKGRVRGAICYQDGGGLIEI